MCTSIVSNKGKTVVGWNLDILDMEYRVVAEDDKVYIAIRDAKEGWLPLFGANARGDFVAMPTCWSYDGRSEANSPYCRNIVKYAFSSGIGILFFPLMLIPLNKAIYLFISIITSSHISISLVLKTGI